MGFCSCLGSVASKVSGAFERGFQAYGSFTYKYPWVIILTSLVIFAGLAYGFTLQDKELDRFKLWAPIDAQALKDADKIKEAFGADFEVERVYVVAKPEGANLLTRDAFQELIDFELGVWDSVEYDDKKYNDVCVKASSVSNESACETSNYPLRFFLTQDATFDESMLANLVAEINDGRGTSDFYEPDSSNYISIDEMFGGTTPADAGTNRADGTNEIEEAQAIYWKFYVDQSELSLEFLRGFETEYEDYVRKFNEKSSHISVHVRLSSSILRESDEAIAEDLQLITVGIMLVVLFSIYILGELNTFRSRILIALVGIVSIVIAFVEAVGFGSYLSIKTNIYVDVVPFLMIGIGVDDMFVLISALKQAPREYDGEQMMRYMMKHAGVSVTITSITNVGAFAIGAITTIPAVRNFCLYAAFGMFFDYLNQITLFSSLLAYDIRRSQRPLGDCCGLIFCKPESKMCCQGKYILDGSGNPQEPLSQRLIYKGYSKFLMKTPVRIGVCVVFAILLGVNIYSVTQATTKFSYEWFSNEDFDVQKAIDIRDEYFDTTGYPINFYSLYSEFTTSEAQRQLEQLVDDIQTCDGCTRSWFLDNSVDSWYASFKTWVDQGGCVNNQGNTVSLADGVIPSDDFYECLEQFGLTAEGFFYLSKLAWKDGALVAAAIEATLILIETTADKGQILKDTRSIAKSGPDDTYAYNNEFLDYEHMSALEKETTIQLSSALALVLATILFANADFILALLVFLIVGLTLIGQLGTITFWGEHMNVLSMTNAIMAIGVALDYSAHMAYVFKCCPATNNVKRARQSLRTIGVGIFNGGFSTLLAILPLVMAKNYGPILFFKCWLSIVLYGLSHSLILLPVLLSFVGVTPYATVEVEYEDRSPTKTENPSAKELSGPSSS